MHKRYQQRLEALSQQNYNLDLERKAEYTADKGWHLDAYETELPGEAPGPPLSGGPFQIACDVLREYRFPPPDLITGIFLPEVPLEQRVMLLRARFMGLTFYFGVRINGVVDLQREETHGTEQVWGYQYATLEGHFEQGQIEFSIVKHLESGKVFFRISAFSKTGYIPNPFYRLGFAMFGRRLQRRFAYESLERMNTLVKATLSTGYKVGATPEVKPASSDRKVEEKLEDLEHQASKKTLR